MSSIMLKRPYILLISPLLEKQRDRATNRVELLLQLCLCLAEMVRRHVVFFLEDTAEMG